MEGGLISIGIIEILHFCFECTFTLNFDEVRKNKIKFVTNLFNLTVVIAVMAWLVATVVIFCIRYYSKQNHSIGKEMNKISFIKSLFS
jgi:heme/copper-type cytochrome/quinol oxidase subunit 2